MSSFKVFDDACAIAVLFRSKDVLAGARPLDPPENEISRATENRHNCYDDLPVYFQIIPRAACSFASSSVIAVDSCNFESLVVLLGTGQPGRLHQLV